MPVRQLSRLAERGGKRVEDDPPGTPIPFVASMPGEKRDGRNLDPKKWDINARYASNPVVSLAHNLRGVSYGKGVASVADGALLVDITFDQEDPEARLLESKYRRGFMNAVSVAWDDVDKQGRIMTGPVRSEADVASYQLYDVSLGLVGVDERALAMRQVRALLDEGGEVRASVLRTIQEALGEPEAVEPDGEDDVTIDVEVEAEVIEESPIESAPTMTLVETAQMSTRGLPEDMAAAMVAVFSREPSEEDNERLKAYRILKPHYERRGWTMPEWLTSTEVAALDDDNWRALFLNGELERIGKVISTRNMQELRAVAESMGECLQRLQSVIDAAGGTEDGSSSDNSGGRALDLAEVYAGLVARVTPTKEISNA